MLRFVRYWLPGIVIGGGIAVMALGGEMAAGGRFRDRGRGPLDRAAELPVPRGREGRRGA